MEFSLAGFAFLKFNREIPMCSPDLTFKCICLSIILRVVSSTHIFNKLLQTQDCER